MRNFRPWPKATRGSFRTVETALAYQQGKRDGADRPGAGDDATLVGHVGTAQPLPEKLIKPSATPRFLWQTFAPLRNSVAEFCIPTDPELSMHRQTVAVPWTCSPRSLTSPQKPLRNNRYSSPRSGASSGCHGHSPRYRCGTLNSQYGNRRFFLAAR
jgi:hypothetical protein